MQVEPPTTPAIYTGAVPDRMHDWTADADADAGGTVGGGGGGGGAGGGGGTGGEDEYDDAVEGSPYVNMVVEGCCHGKLDEIYAGVKQIERRRATKVDLLLCCGDFQALRNEDDYDSLAVPPKYREMGSFYKYYSGERVAPVLTIVIGGNHEASNYMLDLFHGGWLAPNIYYLGVAGVVNFGGIRIGGASGIYKSGDYPRGHFERFPFDRSTLRSVYHIRRLQVYQLSQLVARRPSHPDDDDDGGGGAAEREGADQLAAQGGDANAKRRRAVRPPAAWRTNSGRFQALDVSS